MKRLISFLLVLTVLVGCTISVSAAVFPPTKSFTKQSNGGTEKIVSISPVYETTGYITPRALGLTGESGTAVDIDCDKQGNIYVLTDSSKIIEFDANNRYLRTFTFTDSTGKPVTFKGASGILTLSEKEMYIADTENGRVLLCENGIVKKEILVPKDALIPSDFVFRPIKIAKDSQNYLYVISEGSYYGAILYDENENFVGFYGANTVKATVLTAISNLWDKLTQNDIKRSKKIRTLPYQFVDLAVDDNDFVYTCTGKNADNKTGQLKMLSPGGTNILTGSDSKNYGEDDKVVRREQTVLQNFANIKADAKGFIYALDSSLGLVYIYDTDSELIVAFGGGNGGGEQRGTFSSACSFTVFGSKIYVADSVQNSITVFGRTDYGEKLFAAQELSLKSDNIAAKSYWEELHKTDALNPVVIKGLAKAAYKNGDYNAALSYSKQVSDTNTYSLALAKVENRFVTENFTWIFIAAVLLIALIICITVFMVKRHIVIVKNKKIRVMISTVFHPFDGFNNIKYKSLGSYKISAVLTLMFFLSSVIRVTLSDFRYTDFNKADYNVFIQVAQTLGLVVLWTVANWAVCILFGGIGKITEVYTVTAYSTLPITIVNLVLTPITFFIVSGNSTLVSVLNALAVIITGIMLCVALMIIHDFSFPKTVFTAAITVIFMILIVFVLFVIGVLLSQVYSFISDIAIEIIRW